MRLRRRLRGLVPSKRPGRKGMAVAELSVLATLIGAIVLGSYWAGGSDTTVAGGNGSAEMAAASPMPVEASGSEPAAQAQAAPATSASSEPVGTAASAEAAPAPGPLPAAATKTADASPEAQPPAAPMAASPAVPVALPPAAPAPDSSAPPVPSFRDLRPMQPVADSPANMATSVAAPAGEPPVFRDPRPLAAPSFKDPRPVVVPSFRDERPVAPDEPARAGATPAAPGAPGSSPTSSPAAPDTESGKAEEPKPFDVGYFLGDRSPMVRSQEEVTVGVTPEATTSQAPAASAPSDPAKPAEPASVDVATSTRPATAPQTPSSDELPTLVALAPGQIKVDGAACTQPSVSSEPLDGGMMRLGISASCHPNELVQISYGGAEIIRKLNAYGSLDYVLDCFAGTSSAVEVRFADGTEKSLPVAANDLDKVSKIAVVWRSRVNLDLHVFEYAAKFGETGHLWSSAPSSLVAARVQGQANGRGYGFISTADDDKSLGDKIEVYTFLHNDQQSTGAIALALDNETRGETPSGTYCGQGALSEIGFDVSILPRRGQVTRQSGVLTRVECGMKLTHEARFNQAALPGLRIRK